MFDFMKSVHAPDKITDPKKVDSLYKYWRWRILLSMYFGYAVFYFTRKSFTFAMPQMVKVLHLDKAEVGILATLFYIVYGLSKFLNGIISDKSNARYFMSIALMMTGVANLFFGASNTLFWFSIFWIINAFFQGAGWPPCAKLLTHWYSKNERGTWWGAWNTCHNVGGALIPLIAGAAATYLGWRYAMYIPGVIALIMGVLIWVGLRDTPETMGLPPVEEYRNDYPDGHSTQKANLSTKEILFKYVLNNKYIWLLCFSYVMVYIIRTAINDWGALYLTENGYSVLSADSCLSFFEIGGFFGSIFAGVASDRIFAGRRGPVNIIYSVGIILAIACFWWLGPHFYFIAASCIFAIGFFVFGPQMLIGVAAAELSHREAAGTATGFLGLFGYLGAALSGYPIGLITQHYSWVGFFITIGVCGVLSIALLMPMWSVSSGNSSTN